jgi:hypothetical protein
MGVEKQMEEEGPIAALSLKVHEQNPNAVAEKRMWLEGMRVGDLCMHASASCLQLEGRELNEPAMTAVMMLSACSCLSHLIGKFYFKIERNVCGVKCTP